MHQDNYKIIMMTNNLKNLVTKTLLVLGVLFIAVSCGKSNSPEAVAEKFLNHMANAEFAEAKKLCDSDTAALVGMMEGMGGETEMEGEKEKIEILSSTVDGDNAVVKYTSSLEEGEKSLDLKKIDGEWKVSFDKENQNKEEGMDAGMEELEGAMDELNEAMDTLSIEVEEAVEEQVAE
ncbi:MAG TPA: hypothetical protein VKZ42_03780 [Flavobacteriaceae bacterium]|nr:hypothetical protein [Flavobacteriaceae bacterium]